MNTYLVDIDKVKADFWDKLRHITLQDGDITEEFTNELKGQIAAINTIENYGGAESQQ